MNGEQGISKEEVSDTADHVVNVDAQRAAIRRALHHSSFLVRHSIFNASFTVPVTRGKQRNLMNSLSTPLGQGTLFYPVARKTGSRRAGLPVVSPEATVRAPENEGSSRRGAEHAEG